MHTFTVQVFIDNIQFSQKCGYFGSANNLKSEMLFAILNEKAIQNVEIFMAGKLSLFSNVMLGD